MTATSTSSLASMTRPMRWLQQCEQGEPKLLSGCPTCMSLFTMQETASALLMVTVLADALALIGPLTLLGKLLRALAMAVAIELRVSPNPGWVNTPQLARVP